MRELPHERLLATTPANFEWLFCHATIDDWLPTKENIGKIIWAPNTWKSVYKMCVAVIEALSFFFSPKI